MILIAALLPALAAGDAAPRDAVKLPAPRVEYRVTEASPSRVPWIDANGWQIQRAPDRSYFYDVPANAAALACAEAYAYSARATVHTSGDGVDVFRRMLDFLKTLPDADWPVMANIGVIDDGSAETGEMMKLLARHNLLYTIMRAPGPKLDLPDPRLDLNVRLGSAEYPRSDAANPDALAHKIRAKLGDDKRLMRLYGSEVVIARLVGSGDHARLHLLNYSTRPVNGMRVRVLGRWPKQRVMAYDKPQLALRDIDAQPEAVEFTISEMSTYAVIDLSR